MSEVPATLAPVINIGPQPGPQTMFMECSADIAVYGGAAGGGKSYALLLEPLRHYNNELFGGVIFRRDTVQIRNEGGLWDESVKMYMPFRCHPREAVLEWTAPTGWRMKFAHLQHERSVYDWQGSQIPFIGFDELTHFSEFQFFYMLSRNRSTSGVAGYVRATCNPDADSWVRRLIDWWIGPDGYPVAERSGVVRWFIRVDDSLIWGDTPEELTAVHGTTQIPKSFTFIASSIYDNKVLMENDPSYLSNLMAQSRVERLRLLGGNWNVRATAGMYFQKDWFPIVDSIPGGWIRRIRYWDRAATKPSENNKDPDWTAGVLMYKYPDGTYLVAHVARTRNTPFEVEKFIKATAEVDGRSVEIWVEEDPGQAGKADADNYVARVLPGWGAKTHKPSGDKVTRALPVSAMAERGLVKLFKGHWNAEFLSECENFPPEEATTVKKKGEADFGHDDQVDALSGAYNQLASAISTLQVFSKK